MATHITLTKNVETNVFSICRYFQWIFQDYVLNGLFLCSFFFRVWLKPNFDKQLSHHKSPAAHSLNHAVKEEKWFNHLSRWTIWKCRTKKKKKKRRWKWNTNNISCANMSHVNIESIGECESGKHLKASCSINKSALTTHTHTVLNSREKWNVEAYIEYGNFRQWISGSQRAKILCRYLFLRLWQMSITPYIFA